MVHSRGHTCFDGIEIDDDGYVHVAEPGTKTILAVSSEAGWLGMTARQTITSGGGVQGPANLVLSDGALCTTKPAFGALPENQYKAIIAIRNLGKN